jgi:4-hydroxy-3-methylbut-2-enyl diphosphate reductase
MYLWNSLVNVDQMRHLGLDRYQFYRAHKAWVWSLALFCIALLLWISFGLSRPAFYLMLFGTVAGSVYHFTIVPPVLRKIVRYKNLKDIPTSRDLFVALAWAVLITFMPATLKDTFNVSPVTFFVFAWVFLLAFLRSVIFDLRDIEGDRIMGRETLVILVGENRARATIQATLILSLAGLVLFAVFAAAPLYSWRDVRPAAIILQAFGALYMLIFMRLSQKIPPNRAALFNLFADAQFYIAGFGAWLANALFA